MFRAHFVSIAHMEDSIVSAQQALMLMFLAYHARHNEQQDSGAIYMALDLMQEEDMSSLDLPDQPPVHPEGLEWTYWHQYYDGAWVRDVITDRGYPILAWEGKKLTTITIPIHFSMPAMDEWDEEIEFMLDE